MNMAGKHEQLCLAPRCRCILHQCLGYDWACTPTPRRVCQLLRTREKLWLVIGWNGLLRHGQMPTRLTPPNCSETAATLIIPPTINRSIDVCYANENIRTTRMEKPVLKKRNCVNQWWQKIDGKITLNIIGISTLKTENYIKSKITNYCEELDRHSHAH